MPTEEREVRNPEGQQAGPRVADGPVITNLGHLHKSNLLISAGVSPPLPSTLQNSPTVMGVRLTSLPASHAQNTAKCSQHGSLPGLPPLSTSTSQISQRLPLESRGILRASETGALLKSVPFSTLETSGLPPKTSSRGGQSQALAEVESKEDSLLYPLRSARLITGTKLHANEGVRRPKSPVEKGSSEQEDPKVLPKQRQFPLCRSGCWQC